MIKGKVESKRTNQNYAVVNISYRDFFRSPFFLKKKEKNCTKNKRNFVGEFLKV